MTITVDCCAAVVWIIRTQPPAIIFSFNHIVAILQEVVPAEASVLH
jgi:hypothetical protein